MKLKKGTLLFLLLTCLAYTALAQTDYELQGSDVTINENGIITGCKDAFSNTNIIIPVQIGTETITGIDDTSPGVFQDKNLVSVKFANNSEVTTIGSYAFNYNPIGTLTLPTRLKTIGEYAFRYNQITELTLPTTLTSIGNSAFQRNENARDNNEIAELILPTTLETIGEQAFQYNKIAKLTFPENSQLTTIGADAFSGNTGLMSITLPEHAEGTGVTYKDSNDQEYNQGDTFTNFERSLVMLYTLQAGDVTVVDGIITACTCTFNSKRIIIPVQIGTETITGIGDTSPGVFEQKNLISVAFASDSEVTTIGSNAFYENKIKTLTLPPSLTVIGDSAFYNNSLTSVTFNDNPNKSQIQSIGNNVFSGNTGLMSITLPELAGGDGVIYKDSNNQEYKPGDTFTNFGRSLVILYTLQAGDVTVVDGIITECKCTFDSKRIIIPVQIDGKTITGIADIARPNKGVFDDKNLVAVAFASDSEVTTIGDNAFRTNQITELSLPSTLTTIGEYAFASNKITTLTMPEGLTTIGKAAFAYNEITTLSLPEGETTIGEEAFAYNEITTLTLPEGLTTIGKAAFATNKITTLSLPESLTTIGGSAFGNNLITELTLPTTLKTIGVFAFSSNNITTLTLPPSLESIGESAFLNNAITTLTIPNDAQLTTIGKEAFQGNEDDGGNKLTTLTLPPSLETIGESAFLNNAITTLTIPNDAQLTTIGKEAFQGNEDDGGNKLTTLTLPPSLETIGESAFQHNSLTTVTFDDDPNKSNIKSIGTDAFSNNDEFTSITLPEHAEGAGVTYKDSNDQEYKPGDSFTNFERSLTIVIPPFYTLKAGDVTVDGGIITECLRCEDFDSKRITIPVQIGTETITGIGDTFPGVFEQKNLISVAFASDSEVTTIGSNAFYENKIKTLTLPPTLTTIGKGAFRYNRLTSVTFNDNPNKSQIQSIGTDAFSNNYEFTSITLPEHAEGAGVTYKDSNDQEYNQGDTFTNFERSLVMLYTLQEGDVTVVDGIITACTCTFNSKRIIIPVQIGTETIKGIFDKFPGVFQDKNLVSVEFAVGSEVTTIGIYAFYLNKITELTFPENSQLASIGERAFSNNKIAELTLPSTLTTIGRYAFFTNQITELTFPENSQLASIGERAFSNNKIAELTLPSTLTTIGRYAFFTNQITELTFPENSQLTTIVDYAFQDNQITTLALPPSLESIGESAFLNNSLTTVTFDDDPNKSNIKSIGTNAFSENTGLTGITLPNHVGGVDVTYKDSEGNNYDPNDENKNTFTDFTRSLVAVLPPHTLTAGDVEVDGEGIITKCHCTFLSNSIIIPVQIDRKTITGIVDKSSPDKGVFQDKNLIAVAFEQGSQITSIGDNAFQNNQITTLTLPTALTTIGDWAFRNNEIAALTLPTTLTTIGNFAFESNQITELTFHDDSQLTTIGSNAFQDNNITELTFPENSQLTTIGNFAFESNQITELTFHDDSQLATIGSHAFRNNLITELTFPDDSQLTSIGKSAFAENPSLDSFTLPSVTKERFRTYWQDGSSADLGENLTIPKADFGKSFELVSIEQVTLTLTIDGDGVGLVEGLKAGDNPVDKGQPLTLTAKPNGGNEFEKWVDGSDISTPTYTISADKTQNDLSIEVHFKKNSFNDPVELTISTDGQGTVTPNIGINTYKKGTIVDLTATPDEGWRFDKWVITGGEDNNGNPTIVTVDANKTATAHFVKQFTLTTAVEGEQRGTIARSVEPNNDKGEYDSKTEVTLTATSNEGWKFDKWVISGGEENNDNPTIVTVDADKTATAHFVEAVILTLTIVETGASGVVSGLSAGENKIDKGVDFKLEAMPASGQRFVSWTIGVETIVTEEYTLLATDTEANIGITVTFEAIPQQVTLTLAIEGEGSINPLVKPNSVDPDNEMKGMYDINTKVTLTATPNDGWRFDKWVISDEQDKTDETTIVTVDVNKTATAHFVQLVTLTTFVEGQQGGTISTNPKPSLEGNQYDIKTKVTLTATSNEGWRFDKWVISDEENKTDNPTIVTVDADKTVTAHFVQQVTLTLTIEETGASNVVSGLSAGENKIDKGADFKLKAMPASGQRFVSWTIDGKTITNEEYILLATDTETDIGITVTFVAIQVTLTLAIEGEGSINPLVKPNSVDPDNEMKGMYDINTKVELTATPNDGWRFDKWVISDEQDKTDKTTTITLDTDKTVTAHFVQQVTLTLTIEETGASNVVSGLSAGENKIDKGADFKLKAMPASGQRFVSWTINGKTITNEEYTLPATDTEDDISIKVTFEAIPQQVTLTLAIEGEGSINPLVKPNSVDPDNEMKGMYDINTEIELTATPNEGWRFDKWEISDEENKTENPTTITLDQDKTVTAHFVEGEEAITSILTEVVSATPYPNPVTSQITLKAKDGDLIQLFSQKGKQQYSTQHTGNEVHTIDVSTMPVGVYLVRITDAEGNTTTKRIVKK